MVVYAVLYWTQEWSGEEGLDIMKIDSIWDLKERAEAKCQELKTWTNATVQEFEVQK